MRSETEVFDKRNTTITEMWLSRKRETSGVVGYFKSHMVLCARSRHSLAHIRDVGRNQFGDTWFPAFVTKYLGLIAHISCRSDAFMQIALRDQVGTLSIQLLMKGLLELHCFSPASWLAAYQQTLHKSMSQFPETSPQSLVVPNDDFERSIQDRDFKSPKLSEVKQFLFVYKLKYQTLESYLLHLLYIIYIKTFNSNSSSQTSVKGNPVE